MAPIVKPSQLAAAHASATANPLFPNNPVTQYLGMVPPSANGEDGEEPHKKNSRRQRGRGRRGRSDGGAETDEGMDGFGTVDRAFAGAISELGGYGDSP